MATINYIGPDELIGLIHLFDLEFALLDGTSGRATAAALTVESAVEVTEQALLDLGFSINNADIYDAIYLDINFNYLDVTDTYKSIVVGTTASG